MRLVFDNFFPKKALSVDCIGFKGVQCLIFVPNYQEPFGTVQGYSKQETYISLGRLVSLLACQRKEIRHLVATAFNNTSSAKFAPEAMVVVNVQSVQFSSVLGFTLYVFVGFLSETRGADSQKNKVFHANISDPLPALGWNQHDIAISDFLWG